MKIEIERGSKKEIHELVADPSAPGMFMSSKALAESQEFGATLYVTAGGNSEALSFEIHEPEHHHDLLCSLTTSMQGHMLPLPEYVKEVSALQFDQF